MSKDKSGYIVAAAFIGPGTVTTASLAGAGYGFHLAWALLFSIFATMVLQDMAARLGIGTGKSLSTCLMDLTTLKPLRFFIAFLIIAAIGIGNAAYESGNLTGAAIGLNTIIPLGNASWSMLLGVVACVLLLSGKYKLIETALVCLVAIMALVFVVTLAVAQPDIGTMLTQLFSPRIDAQSITMVLALIGTTIVPYNLFLHASLVSQQYKGANKLQAVKECRRQSVIAIGMGGAITLVIVATAMTAFFGQAATLNAGNMGEQLAPVLGHSAKWFFAAGLFAAGLTSTITAPLAAAYAVCGAMGKPAQLDSTLFRIIGFVVIATGVGVASMGFKPLTAILFAQAANGILLPIIAVFLLVVMNRDSVPSSFRNSTISNLVGALIVLFVCALTGYKLVSLVTG
ncbi:Nramp family divalent metal transporter [Alteromonas sp. C1M14]|uniref:Nramp family divalent metal transporter n=1 Tax=Alteromonas sp. C1M14 TaxID=2841567 RepID=UPI001C0994C0|nr:Nramp family divalent metal transporter [Alteromonas sp. C1M14]MBU2979508.1 Nramp family divalent metal transporter [Alteromonas sp. C1M14]